jgi:large subunit ribosomal protein L15
MFTLHSIKALNKKRKRIGRGGKLGGTSTRGFGGQKARSGDSNVRIGFEGGQMPLFRRLPKRGFNNANFKTEYQIVNLTQLNAAFAAGASVTDKELIEKGLVKKPKTGFILIKILGKGTLSKSLTVAADAFSQAARSAIEAQGGKTRLNEEKVTRGTPQ